MNPNTPVIVGIAQILQRTTDPLIGDEPIDMMINAIKDAARDAENETLLKQIESVRVVRGIWRYKQPAAYIAEQIGCAGAETIGTPFGGNSVQSLLNMSAR